VRKVALTVLLAGVLAFTSGGVVAAEPGHQDGKDRFPEVIALPTGFRPEGISIGKGTSFYVGSVVNGAIYRGDVRTGKGAVLVPGVTGHAATGTEVDKRNRLWVSGAGTGTGTVYDAETGKLLKSYQFVADPVATPTFINDVVVTKDAAYFTDSLIQVLYVVPIGRGGRLGDAYSLPLTGDLVFVDGFNANGIEASPDGDSLLVIQSNTGLLFKVSAKFGTTKQVDLGGTTLVNGDGLLLQDRSILYVVQNQDNQIAVIKLDRSFRSGKQIDTITNDNFQVPTTVGAFGKYLYAVNARFGIPDPDTADYSVVRVDAHRGH
jgi:sugar lactone lactonase YvrE